MGTPSATRPFAVRLERAEESGAHFAPGASVVIGPALRASGFLSEVSGNDLKDLLLLLTFAGPEGNVLPTLPQLAGATGLPHFMVRARMRRLARSSWRGKQLVREIRRESGLDAFAPSPHLLEVWPAPMPASPQSPVFRAAGREAVVAHSRAAYARRRKDVEAEIARMNGWDRREDADRSPEGPERAALRQQLLGAGVSREQAGMLLDQFDAERIRRQIGWLPYRNARDPARYLVAALSGDYGPPPGMPHAATHPPDPVPDANPPATT